MSAFSSIAELLLPLAGGALIGLLHFSGLWITTRRLPRERRPALLLLGSFLLRSLLCASGLLLVAGGRLGGIGASLIGFLAIRGYLIGRVRRGSASAVSVPGRTGGASRWTS